MPTFLRPTFTAAAGVLVGLSQLACSSGPGPAEARKEQPVEVAIHTMATTDQPAISEVGGIVQARTTAVLMSRIVAPVAEVRVAPGARVAAGDVLVVLDSGDLAASARRAQASVEAARQGASAANADRDAAEASLRLARATHERIAAVAAKRSATAQELDEATAAMTAAEARLKGAAARALEAVSALESARAASDSAAATEGFARITAPFAGVITQKQVEPGNMAMPGTPLVVLEDTRGFRLDVRVDESRARDIAPGAVVSVVIDGTPSEQDSAIDGTVSEIARAVDSNTHTTLVKVTLPDRPWLRAGMFGRARFRGPTRPTLTVPAEAVLRRGQVSSVFTVENDVARLRLVNLAGTDVLAGLAPGDRVIVKPPAGLVDGQRVRAGGR